MAYHALPHLHSLGLDTKMITRSLQQLPLLPSTTRVPRVPSWRSSATRSHRLFGGQREPQCRLLGLLTHTSASTSDAQHVKPAADDQALSVSSAPSAAGNSSALDDIPPAKLKELRRLGLEMKDRIKMGRRGVAEGFVSQIYMRWNTSEVAKLYCKGKHATNMKLLTEQLEERTGGVVVHKAGGSVFLYRGEPWPREPPPMPAPTEEEEGGSETFGDIRDWLGSN